VTGVSTSGVESHPARAAGDTVPRTEGVAARSRRLLGIPGWIVFPLLVLLATLVLGALKLTGSSVAIYAPPGDHGGIVAGRARNLRTDEWFVRTPLVARQVALGLPEHDRMGVGEHDMALINDLPTRGWETVLRPHTLPYHVFGIERAFAFEWWTVLLVLPAIGLYAFALALGVRPLTAALISMLVVLSPVVQWWTVPWTGTCIGYACLAGAALLVAVRARSPYLKAVFAILAGWLAACLVVVFYPPWVLPMMLIVGAAAAAVISQSYPRGESARRWWFGLLGVLAVAGVVAAAFVLSFVLAHRETIHAITATIYPGQRRNAGGSGDFATLLGAPFDLVEASRSALFVTVNGMNQSEAAAGLFTLLAIGVAVLAGPLRSKRPWRNRGVLLAVLGASAVLLAWYLLPIPEGVGRLFLLDRVPPKRLVLPLAVAGALALGLFVDTQRRSESRLPRSSLVLGTAAFAVPTLWAALRLRLDGVLAPRWQVLLLAAAATAGVGLALWGRRLGLWILVGLFAVSAAAVNPLQHGLSVLVDSPAAQLGRELRTRPDTGLVAILFTNPGGDLTAQGSLTASGVPLVTGVNSYPNAVAWRTLFPNPSARLAWNRYNNSAWALGPAGSEPQIQVFPPDGVGVIVDPCDRRLAELGVRTIVTDQELTRSCLTETDRFVQGRPFFVYKVDPAAVGAH
jgi:hypothetical protein